MNGWLLDSLEIEGFRGINNEGDPLVLRFGRDAVNSVSAPNGAGKSSIFDAVAFAIRGGIAKLDNLPATERGSDYYVNLFHSGGIGTVSLTLSPEAGGASVRINVTRAADGTRRVSGPPGVDGEGLLASLDEDFVLLDHKTLQAFIDEKALDRGRAFAGLLGLARYSALRQGLQALANTRAYNNHVDASVLNHRQVIAAGQVARYQTAARTAFQALTQEALADQADFATAVAPAHDALHQIGILKPHCTGKSFDEIVIDDCLATIRVEEGGTDKERLATLLREQPKWEGLITDSLTEADKDLLTALASRRDEALAATSGSLLRDLYILSRDVLASDSWADKNLCPICGHQGDHSILDDVHAKLAHYQTVEALTEDIAAEWSAKNWARAIELEAAAATAQETLQFAEAQKKLATHAASAAEVATLWARLQTLLARAKGKLASIKAERLALVVWRNHRKDSILRRPVR